MHTKADDPAGRGYRDGLNQKQQPSRQVPTADQTYRSQASGEYRPDRTPKTVRREKSEDGSHYTFGLKDIKRAKTKPYTADAFDGADLIGSVSFKVRGKTATVKDDFDFGDEF